MAIDFQVAYFQEAEFRSDQAGDKLEDLNSFTMSFPSDANDVLVGGDFYYRSGEITQVFSGDPSVSRVYLFEKTAFDYKWLTTLIPIYKCSVKSYGGAQVVGIDTYTYVYFWQGIGFFGNYPYEIRFLPASDLPAGLEYDFSEPMLFSDNAPLLFLYGLGNQVYSFFPSISSIMDLGVNGMSFFWLLTSGFVVYCAFAFGKWAFNII